MEAQVIECRSSQQIYEDGLVAIHDRCTKWKTELRNARCFTWQDREWKISQLKGMDALIGEIEAAILGESDLPIDLYILELTAIRCSSMQR